VSGPFLFHVIEGAPRHLSCVRCQPIGPLTLPTPGSKIRVQGFSRCTDGDRDLGPRGQFPIDPGLQPRGTEPRAFGTRPRARQPLGRCPDAMASRSEDTEDGRKSLSPRPSSLRSLYARQPRCHHRTRANGLRSCGLDFHHEQHESEFYSAGKSPKRPIQPEMKSL
jgi:hypothetical protein